MSRLSRLSREFFFELCTERACGGVDHQLVHQHEDREGVKELEQRVRWAEGRASMKASFVWSKVL